MQFAALWMWRLQTYALRWPSSEELVKLWAMALREVLTPPLALKWILLMVAIQRTLSPALLGERCLSQATHTIHEVDCHLSFLNAVLARLNVVASEVQESVAVFAIQAPFCVDFW